MTAPTRRSLSVRTPGAPPADDGLGETDADALSADTSDMVIPADASESSRPAPMPADLKAYIDAQIAAGVAAGLASSGVRAKAPAAQVLPDQSEVDPRAITALTLTRQGWVVPVKMGAVPEHLKTTMLGA
jgi:hypothetical protein